MEFCFNRRLDRRLVFDLAAGHFIAKHEDALFLGPPGTGKSHLAQGISHAAIQQGHKVLYPEAHVLLDELAEATLHGTRRDHLTELATVPLLIVDDLGMRKLPAPDPRQACDRVILARPHHRGGGANLSSGAGPELHVGAILERHLTSVDMLARAGYCLPALGGLMPSRGGDGSKNKHAAALGALGASKGGKARAARLSHERRSEIAKKAAIARWSDRLIKATHEAVLRIGDAEFPCAVLEGGTRVLTESRFMEGMGMYRSGALSTRRRAGQEDGGAHVPLYLAFKNLQPFILKHLGDVHATPMKYLTLTGQVAHGIRADFIPKICEVWLDARAAKVLGKTQEKVAARAELILRALAHVGIIALVDEATGYQYDRARWALAEILETFISKELARWAKTFDDDYYREIFRLRGWDAADITKRPGIVGHWTTDIVYSRVAPGVLARLREVTPRDEHGRLKHKLFQRLTPDTGVPALREHLASVTTIMKLAPDWDWFMDRLDRVHPKYNSTLLLPFRQQNGRSEEGGKGSGSSLATLPHHARARL